MQKISASSLTAMAQALFQTKDDNMQARLDPRKVAPEAMKALSGLHNYVRGCGLDHKLLELVKLRASQMNGCAWCIDMHTKQLRAAGQTEQRLYLLSAWLECPCYSERERAPLTWTEALTRLTNCNVPDEVFALARAQFTEEELVKLTLAIIAINGANRINAAFRTVPGNYQPEARTE
jgi:AhpD family alkylhydroperoxidase